MAVVFSENQTECVVGNKLYLWKVSWIELHRGTCKNPQAEKIKVSIPLQEDALLTGLPRGELTLDYGIERYRFEIEWTERILRMLKQVAGQDI